HMEIEGHWLELARREGTGHDTQLVEAEAINLDRCRRPRQRRQLERRADDGGRVSERAAHDLREIVAGDVLYDLPASLRQRAIGGGQPDANHQISRRSEPVAL